MDSDPGDMVGDSIVEFPRDADAFEVESLPSQLLLLFTDLFVGRTEFL